MTKKTPKCPKTHMDVACRLPIPVLKFYMDIAGMTGLTPNDVISVILAIEAKRSAAGKFDER